MRKKEKTVEEVKAFPRRRQKLNEKPEAGKKARRIGQGEGPNLFR